MKSTQRKSSRRKLVALAMAAAGAVAFAPAIARADLTFINAFGSQGSGNGQLEGPGYLAVAPDGNVYVTDQGNNRVEVFNATGTFLSTFGTEGSGTGQFDNPLGIAVGPNGNVFVSDYFNNRVEIFNSANAYVGTFGTGGSGNGQFSDPSGMAVNSAGTIYVADNGNDRVEVFNSSNVYSSTIGSGGTGNGQFSNPSGVALDSSGNLYVADTDNNRIQIFNSTGGFENSFGSEGSGNGQFFIPSGVGVAADGLIYVADSDNDRIQVFTSAGAFESSFGGEGTGNGAFLYPTDVAVTSTGMVYVTDQNNNRIERLFDPNAWVSGTNSFTNSAVGPTSVTVGSGQIMGTSLTLSSAMGLVVGGTTTINSGGTLTQSGGSISTGSLTVSGRFNYEGGSFSVTTTGFTVAAGGLFQALVGGTISAPVNSSVSGEMSLDGGTTFATNVVQVNSGGLLAVNQATITGGTITVLSGGELRLINPVSSLLSLSTFSNSGLLDGSGQINGALANSTTGQVSVALGQTLAVTGSENTNAGFINLSGGSLHYTQTLESGGTIEGFGALNVTGGLTIENVGTLALAGSSSVTGTVSNTSGGTIHLSGNSPNVFFSAVSNSGNLNVDAGASGTFYGAYTGSGPIVNNGTIFLNANSVAGTITGTGNLTINNNTVLQLTSTSLTNTQGSLTLSGTGTLDITNNAMVINYGVGNPAPTATFAGEIKSGYNGDAWNGIGIISSKVAAVNALLGNPHAYAVAYANASDPAVAADHFTPGTVVIEPAIVGDANLDGKVNFADFQLLSASFNQPNTSWDQGNFNYGAKTNFADFQLLAANFNDSTSLDNAEFDAMNALALSHGESLVANPDGDGFSFVTVPEPAAFGMLGVMGAALLGRRKRKC